MDFIVGLPLLYNNLAHKPTHTHTKCIATNHNIYIYINICINVKVLPVQAIKALRVGRGIALPYLRPRH